MDSEKISVIALFVMWVAFVLTSAHLTWTSDQLTGKVITGKVSVVADRFVVRDCVFQQGADLDVRWAKSVDITENTFHLPPGAEACVLVKDVKNVTNNQGER